MKNKICRLEKDKFLSVAAVYINKYDKVQDSHPSHTHISEVQGHLPHLSKNNDKLQQIVEASQCIVCTN